MGLFSDTLEENRNRSEMEWIDPCMIIGSSLYDYNKYTDFEKEFRRYKSTAIDENEKARIKQEFTKKSVELEKLKAGYLVTEKLVHEIFSRVKIKSVYMDDLLSTLLNQLNDAYSSICLLRTEIDKQFAIKNIPEIHIDSEKKIRIDLLERLMNTLIYHMEKGVFPDTCTFRKVISDSAEIIRVLKNETYLITDKEVVTYYLMESAGLKLIQHKCRNCGKPLLNNIGYCLNCYERNY